MNTEMEHFILFYLCWYWAMCILYKNNWLPNNLDKIGHNLKNDFFLRLSECKFCMDNWTASFSAICLFCYTLDFYTLGWGVLCASISAHFRQ